MDDHEEEAVVPLKWEDDPIDEVLAWNAIVGFIDTDSEHAWNLPTSPAAMENLTDEQVEQLYDDLEHVAGRLEACRWNMAARIGRLTAEERDESLWFGFLQGLDVEEMLEMRAEEAKALAAWRAARIAERPIY